MSMVNMNKLNAGSMPPKRDIPKPTSMQLAPTKYLYFYMNS